MIEKLTERKYPPENNLLYGAKTPSFRTGERHTTNSMVIVDSARARCREQ